MRNRSSDLLVEKAASPASGDALTQSKSRPEGKKRGTWLPAHDRYAGPFAFSTAFKRVRGISPRQRQI